MLDRHFPGEPGGLRGWWSSVWHFFGDDLWGGQSCDTYGESRQQQQQQQQVLAAAVVGKGRQPGFRSAGLPCRGGEEGWC